MTGTHSSETEFPSEPGRDPFEEFNRSIGMGVIEDPHPEFHRQRAESPFISSDIRGKVLHPGEHDSAEDLGPPSFTPLTYAANHEVLRDGERFSSTAYAELMGPVMGHSILEMDEPEHGAYRRLVQHAFTRKEMDQWETELVTPIVDELIDGFIDEGSVDLVSRLLFPFPVNVIAGLLGLPRSDLPMFHRLAVELIGITIDWDRGVRASEALRSYFLDILEERRREPRHDVISVLAQAEVDGHVLTDEEIVAFLRLLLPAGAETTYRSSSNLMVGLLSNPEQWDAVRADPELLPQAIEEGLRWEPPLLTIIRTAVADTEVEGVEIPKGSTIVCNLGAANRDPARWDRPDEFDLFREAKPHLAFAFGPHMCLGLHLARMETRAAVLRLAERLPGLRLDPDAPPPAITGLLFRAPTRLQVVWDRP